MTDLRVWRPFRRSRAPIALAIAVLAGVHAADARAGQTLAVQAEAALYRVFLRDGGTLVSYGEFAHVGDGVVLSIPVGGTESEPGSPSRDDRRG